MRSKDFKKHLAKYIVIVVLGSAVLALAIIVVIILDRESGIEKVFGKADNYFNNEPHICTKSYITEQEICTDSYEGLSFIEAADKVSKDGYIPRVIYRNSDLEPFPVNDAGGTDVHLYVFDGIVVKAEFATSGGSKSMYIRDYKRPRFSEE